MALDTNYYLLGGDFVGFEELAASSQYQESMQTSSHKPGLPLRNSSFLYWEKSLLDIDGVLLYLKMQSTILNTTIVHINISLDKKVSK